MPHCSFSDSEDEIDLDPLGTVMHQDAASRRLHGVFKASAVVMSLRLRACVYDALRDWSTVLSRYPPVTLPAAALAPGGTVDGLRSKPESRMIPPLQVRRRRRATAADGVARVW
jgi:hypothetical protein